MAPSGESARSTCQSPSASSSLDQRELARDVVAEVAPVTARDVQAIEGAQLWSLEDVFTQKKK